MRSRAGQAGAFAYDVDCGSLRVEAALPCGPTRSEPCAVFAALKGATILAIGAPEGADLEGGGLVIDYGFADGVAKRLVLAFNEAGMWVEFDGPVI